MRVRWAKQAERQLLEVLQYIAKDKPSAAKKLAQTIEAVILELKEQPFIGRTLPEFCQPFIRERIVIPYRIIYAIDTEVLILAVCHSRQQLHPEKLNEQIQRTLGD